MQEFLSSRDFFSFSLNGESWERFVDIFLEVVDYEDGKASFLPNGMMHGIFTQKTPRGTFVETSYSFGAFVWETERTKKGNLMREKKGAYEKFWKRGEDERILVSYKKVDNSIQKFKSFWKSGNIQSLVRFLNGKEHGKALAWHETGALSKIVEYSEGQLHGEALSFDEVGNIVSSGFYSLGKREGVWLTVTPKGKKKQVWKRGKLVCPTRVWE
uniref:MORN repeat containing protein n=1 Tax=Marseillevirus sp. TaxID=2809551 RepID=A0AA96EPN1_9VIRU|nr:MORN repeat containing protein [Marseillevirus sp.]